jgi:ankyrin repeat protein
MKQLELVEQIFDQIQKEAPCKKNQLINELIDLIIKMNEPHHLNNLIWHGKTDRVKYLIKKGADINAIVDKQGNNLLMIAIMSLNKDLAKFLIANNINLKVMNSNCKTAFILAKENDLLDIAVLISHTLSLQNNK